MKAVPFDLDTAPLDRGTVLLEASAGTGKTYTLVGLLLRLLLERRIPSLDRALVVTFTIAATEELKNRLRAAIERLLRVLDGERCDDPFFRRLAALDGARALLRTALDDFDRVPIATIHGFCKRLLDESAFETRQPFRLDFVVDALPMVHRAAADVLRRTYAPLPDVQHAVLTLAALTPKELVTAWRVWRRHPQVSLPPEAAAPTPHLDLLASALARAAQTFDDQAREVLLRVQFRAKESPFTEPLEIALPALARQLAEAPLLALGTLAELAPATVRKSSVQRSVQPPPDHPFFAACAVIAAELAQAAAHLRARLLHELDERLARDKLRQHVLSYDDLLQRAHAALQDPARREVVLAAVRSRYEVALIDEFQDTDALQYEIFAACFARRPLFLVGDPKQSIYGFRGADLAAYLAAAHDAVAVETLTTNHRSSQALVQAVGHLFAGKDAFLTDGIQLPAVRAAADRGALGIDGDDGPAFRWRLLPLQQGKTGPVGANKEPAEARIAKDVAAEITRLLAGTARLDGRALLPRDFAVLTRTNKQALRVQDALRDQGVVSAIGKAGDIFDTDELVAVERLLRAVLQPRDLRLARAAMATPLWGHDAGWVRASNDDDDRFDAALRRLDDWRRLWHRHGFVVMAERLLAELDVVPRLLAQRGGERSLTNYQQLFELLHQAEHTERLSPDGLLGWLQHERRHREEIDYQLRELRLESDEDAVQILTVHGSKGLQYEVVFCPFQWDARRPRAPELVTDDAGRRVAFDLDEATKARIEVARLAEDVRLCYVAMTRARRRCYVHFGLLGRDANRSAPSWLLWPAPAGLDLRTMPEQFEAWAEFAKDGFARMEQRVADLCAGSGGTMGSEMVPEMPQAVPVRTLPSPPLGPPRTARREPSWRSLHSFTSLVAGAHGGDPAPDVADPPAPGPAVAPRSPLPIGHGIFSFARGARAGQCLHALLERVDLDALDGDTAPAQVRETLRAFGLLEPEAHAGPIVPVDDVLQNLRDLAAARVGAGGPPLAELCRGAHAIEWKFTLPTGGGTIETLAAAFAEHGSELGQRYASRLRQLPPRHVHGFLVGFVDRIATHDGRHWILDWKSNHLGAAAADYGSEALAAAMVDSDYVLQYHLYVLALHRQLRARVRDYDYARHHGGVCYVFLRGAVPDTANGMLCDRVPSALVAAMDQWAGGAR